ncbi:flagellar motor switch protein FliG [Leptospira bouyouniensis]|uniref:Flagellar motor switch protein FliG n=1 Tax=Leptospira bouyouniensis TaxID=2484911 RepID=A0A7I0HP43_9LEPT|nr:flagellar motor switch protein FliG [Leptospira bouyouniensis]TGL03366.1 flagellar motor switch protein FliG [Leptospira bouyouniensis]
MIYTQGNNYHFFLADMDSVARFVATPLPFYPIPLKEIPSLPSVSTNPIVFPRFLYSLSYNRQSFEPVPISTPPYFQSPIQKSEWFQKPKPGFSLTKRIVGGQKQNPTNLYRSKREKFNQTKYLSLRDIVNPEFDEKKVLETIDSLYVDKKSKLYLNRLVAILFSGTKEEELKIITNLFRFETDFAQFLNHQMFTVELIPLIHGIFLQEILRNHDERFFRYILPRLSPPVLDVVRKSISKNKMNQIEKAPSQKPPEGEDLISIIESELYKRFARNLYYEEGQIYTFREYGEAESKELIPFESSEKFDFCMNGDFLSFFGKTKTKLFFKTSEWIDSIRFDLFLTRKELETNEFHRLPKDLILEIPYYETGLFLVGAGITKDKKPFEFSLLWFDY